MNWLTERLETVGIIAAPLSGDSSKDDRAEIMRRLQVTNRRVLCNTGTPSFVFAEEGA